MTPRAYALPLALLVAPALSAQTPLTTVRVASGLSSPVHVTAPPNDPDRLFVCQQRGLIRVVRDGVLLATPFLNLSDGSAGGRVSQSGSERGLFSLAFHPDYDQNGYFYVSFTRNSDHASMVRRYSVDPLDPDLADPTSGLTVFGPVNQPAQNHNGGCLVFGPDGKLWLGLGDGGDQGDPNCRAQNGATVLGKLLRLEEDGTAVSSNPFFGVPGIQNAIWALGLRNPWRFSFDRLTGDLYIADVGQSSREEVNFVAAGSGGGENYGWKVMEGDTCFSTSNCTAPFPACNDPTLTDPIHVYNHTAGCSITGGHVYRGCAIPDLAGTYFFGDYCTGRIWSFKVVNGVRTQFTNRTSELAPGGGQSIRSISSFGEDALGELYVVDHDGEVYKIVPAAGIPDVNGNGIADDCEAFSLVRNGTGVNPLSFSPLDEPRLGQTWSSSVDLQGALGSFVTFALGGPTTGPVLGGPTFFGELLGLGPFSKANVGVGLHAIALPFELSFVGRTVPALAGTFQGGSIQLTNAIDARLGL